MGIPRAEALPSARALGRATRRLGREGTSCCRSPVSPGLARTTPIAAHRSGAHLLVGSERHSLQAPYRQEVSAAERPPPPLSRGATRSPGPAGDSAQLDTRLTLQ